MKKVFISTFYLVRNQKLTLFPSAYNPNLFYLLAQVLLDSL